MGGGKEMKGAMGRYRDDGSEYEGEIDVFTVVLGRMQVVTLKRAV